MDGCAGVLEPLLGAGAALPDVPGAGAAGALGLAAAGVWAPVASLAAGVGSELSSLPQPVASHSATESVESVVSVLIMKVPSQVR